MAENNETKQRHFLHQEISSQQVDNARTITQQLPTYLHIISEYPSLRLFSLLSNLLSKVLIGKHPASLSANSSRKIFTAPKPSSRAARDLYRMQPDVAWTHETNGSESPKAVSAVSIVPPSYLDDELRASVRRLGRRIEEDAGRNQWEVEEDLSVNILDDQESVSKPASQNDRSLNAATALHQQRNPPREAAERRVGNEMLMERMELPDEGELRAKGRLMKLIEEWGMCWF